MPDKIETWIRTARGTVLGRLSRLLSPAKPNRVPMVSNPGEHTSGAGLRVPTRRPLKEVTCLHLSDLHCGSPGQVRWPTVKEQVLRDLAECSRELGAPDLILFTGDLAYSGKASEYHQVDSVIREVFDALSAEPLLCPVPGNHDLVRPPLNDLTAQWIRDYFRPHGVRQSFKKSFTQHDCGTFEQVRRMFAGYSEWLERTVIPMWDRRLVDFRLGRLPGDYHLTLAKGNFRLGIAGMNSSYLEIADEIGPVAAEPEQLSQVCVQDIASWCSAHHACLLLMHHPPATIQPEVLVELQNDTYQPHRFAACLCGHKHEHAEHSLNDRRWLQSSSLFGLEKYGAALTETRSMGYSWLRIIIATDEGGTLELRSRNEQPQEGGRFVMVDDPRAPPARPVSIRTRKTSKWVAAIVGSATTCRRTRDAVASSLSQPPTLEASSLSSEYADSGVIGKFDFVLFVFGPQCTVSQLARDRVHAGTAYVLVPSRVDSEVDGGFQSLRTGEYVGRYDGEAGAIDLAIRFFNDWSIRRRSEPQITGGSVLVGPYDDDVRVADGELTRASELMRMNRLDEAVAILARLSAKHGSGAQGGQS